MEIFFVFLDFDAALCFFQDLSREMICSGMNNQEEDRNWSWPAATKKLKCQNMKFIIPIGMKLSRVFSFTWELKWEEEEKDELANPLKVLELSIMFRFLGFLLSRLCVFLFW